MLLERAEITVREGAEDGFAAAMRGGGLAILTDTAGVCSVRFGRGVENPAKFVLLVEWEAMAAHDAFTRQPAYDALLALMRPYSISGAMEHFEIDRADHAIR